MFSELEHDRTIYKILEFYNKTKQEKTIEIISKCLFINCQYITNYNIFYENYFNVWFTENASIINIPVQNIMHLINLDNGITLPPINLILPKCGS